jgi:hypothetical protein
MGDFLKQNWIWIVAPLVLILIGVVYVILTDEPAPGDSEFRYPVY